jgi:hypothetical protein
LEKGDHPEIDTSELLDAEGMHRDHLLMGFLQSAVSLGRMDVASVVVVVMSSFRAIPRQGHLESAEHIVGYLSKINHGTTRLPTNKNDFSAFGTSYHDWVSTVYGDCKGDVPTTAPMAMGRFVPLVPYVADNRMRDMIAETTTYGSAVVAAMNCTDQSDAIVNNQVVKISVPVEAKSLHRTQEAITASKVLVIHPASTLTKHWDKRQVWNDWQLLSLWSEDTTNTVADRYKGQDEVMSTAEVAKKNKIGETANQTANQTEHELEFNRNGVGMEKFIVDATMEDEEVKQVDDVVKGKNLKYAKKMTVHIVSKGRGVSGFTQERAGVKETSDLADVDPFLTKIESCEPSASPMPMDGE